MADIKKIRQYLENCTNGTPHDGAEGTGLTAVHKLIYNHKKNLPKADMIKDLEKFYSDAVNIIDIWDKLSECEQDFVRCIVQYEGKEFLPTTLDYAKKHDFALTYVDKWGYVKNLLDDYRYRRAGLQFLNILHKYRPGTKAAVLFPNGKEMPPFVLEALKRVVEPFKIEYGDFVPETKDRIICREDRVGDFAAIVRFAGSEKLKVKAGTFDVSKANFAKFAEAAGYEEVCENHEGKFCTPKETARNNDFKVTLPLFALAFNSGMLEADTSGAVLPGKKSLELLSMQTHRLAKKLFDDYIGSTKIHELHYITYINAYDGNAWVKWDECRKSVVDMLVKCPVERFVKFEDFDKYMKIFGGDFFRRHLNCAVMVSGYGGYGRQWGPTPDWDECEAQIIRLILSFLSAIGMVDVAYTEKTPRIKQGGDFCVGISGFRVTKLGAWILGLADKYESAGAPKAQNEGEGLVVQPDYSVIVSGLKHRIEHEPHLSKFLTKVSSTENAAIYKIDSQSVIKAFGIEMTPQKIKAYLKKAVSKPFPENVERYLDDWQAKVGRVKISSVTIIETDDKILLEEIKHIKGMDKIAVRDIGHAVAIDEDNRRKAKALIEKNGWLVEF